MQRWDEKKPLFVAPFFGILFDWVSEITPMDPPDYFVDEQRFRPYRFWHHQHHFRSISGGIEMIDRVSYRLKYGPFGGLMDSLSVKRRLEAIFDFRQKTLQRRFDRSQNEAFSQFCV